MENESMTVREVVERVIKDLGEISVPISQMEAIGFHIARSIANLSEVIKAWDAEEKAREEAKEPKLEIVGEPVLVPADEVPDDVKREANNETA